ncbi:T9SS type A sorting domain-containing protein [bacterium AH-315-B15]|nr:T9SS type A sorting domain-containing protein [bacterium AH-315-B15]
MAKRKYELLARITLVVILLSPTVNVYSQSSGVLWTLNFGGVGADNSIIYDSDTNTDGDVYCVGAYQGNIDLDPSASSLNYSSAGSSDMFIQKISFDGDLEWAFSLGGTGGDGAKGVTTGPDGSVYLTGVFDGTVDFDPGTGDYSLTAAGNADIFLLKLDNLGNFVWVNHYPGSGGTSGNLGREIRLDSEGNIFLFGSFAGTCDFDSGAGVYELTSTASGVYHAFVNKMNANGEFLWAKDWRTLNPQDFAVDGEGNSYSVGDFIGTVDFDPGPSLFELTQSAGYRNFLVKLDSAGNFIWAERITGNSCYSIALDETENLYLTGIYGIGTWDFDPSGSVYNLTSAGGDDGFIQKFDTSGVFKWAVSIGGSNSDASYNIRLIDNNTIITTGWFSDICDFDPTSSVFELNSIGQYDAYVLSIDSSGQFNWVHQLGGPGHDRGTVLASDDLGSLYCAGYFQDTMFYNLPGTTDYLVASSFENCFITKFSAVGNIEFSNNEIVDIFPNPSSGQFYIGNDEPANWDLYDSFGKHLISGAGNLIDISTRPAGFYIIDVQVQNGSRRHKLIKN